MDRLKYIRGQVEELIAVELLEYLNKNWLQLGANPKRLSEEKVIVMRGLLRSIDDLIDSQRPTTGNARPTCSKCGHDGDLYPTALVGQLECGFCHFKD